ncbi:MAG: cobalamin B12-binding domain-containing protein [Beijerinckiaceae bacterium]|jgi:methanogenic corrinoid protein MtbC1
MGRLDSNQRGQSAEHDDPAAIAHHESPAAQNAFARAQTNAALSRLVSDAIIPRLSGGRATGQEIAARAAQITGQDVSILVALVRQRRVEDMHAFVSQTFARGADAESIMLQLLAPAADRLGDLWVQDECDFATVTIGVGCLQQAMRRLYKHEHEQPARSDRPRRALLSPYPGEQHDFGLRIVDEFLHRAGWDVCSITPMSGADVEARVRRESFEIAGLSISQEAILPHLETLIASIRRASRNRDIAIMVGGRVFQERPELASQIGADGTASDGRLAVELAESLLAGRSIEVTQ